jgi:hypothetical protein
MAERMFSFGTGLERLAVPRVQQKPLTSDGFQPAAPPYDIYVGHELFNLFESLAWNTLFTKK